ncbi:hypothetical protein LIER_25116 [Lithospermum erythrorhizon]|uniref:Uncharacterized protein n=1 Tax=Lithospermum erythrorhizon TaxID=34254 RepID=A0AAV3R3K1_LITER
MSQGRCLNMSIAYPRKEVTIPVCENWVVPPIFEPQEYEEKEKEEVMTNTIADGVPNDWRQPLIDYFQHGRLPGNLKRRAEIGRRAPCFLYYHDTLFSRSFGEMLLRCLSNTKATQAVIESHTGICGAHQSGVKLHFEFKRMGYYWPTILKNCLDYAQAYKEVSFHHVLTTSQLANGSLQQDIVQSHEENATPYSLVYGTEAVLPLEVQIPSLRVAKVKVRSYQVGDMVLAVIRPIHMQTKNAKLMPKWDSPYVIQEAYPSGAYLMISQEGKKVGPINSRYLKRYYP